MGSAVKAATAAGEPAPAAQTFTNVVVAGGQREQTPESPQGLGDFREIFHFLGTPNHVPRASTDTKLDYASDSNAHLGASSSQAAHHGPQYETDIDDGNIATDQSATPLPSSPTSNGEPPKALSKKTRQRRNRRMRQEAKDASAHVRRQETTVSDSEADEDLVTAMARKASLHNLPGGSPTALRMQSRASSASNLSSIGSGVRLVDLSAADEARSSTKYGQSAPLSPIPDETVPEPSSQPRYNLRSATKQNRKGPLSPIPDRRTPEPTPHSQSERRSSGCQKHDTPPNPSHPFTNPTPPRGHLRFTPASVQPTPTRAQIPDLPYISPTPSPRVRNTQHHDRIQQLVARSRVDRHLDLFHKLLKHFKEDAEHLAAPMNLTNHNDHPDGIHVFVDASNIFIGFMDTLKRARGIAQHTRVLSREPSFGSLALVMEHRRPIAKRILLGSKPEVPAYQQARDIGYNCSILDKVYKQRALTKRQIFFRDRDAGLIPRRQMPPPHGASGDNHGYSTSSDGATPQYAPGALVEQGVDETLHMKMLESIVDYPPATMVLATGDAAQAEYSGGFKVMVERALDKGWKVELVSWNKNLSHQYTDPSFREKWGEQLKIVSLDNYTEELLAEELLAE